MPDTSRSEPCAPASEVDTPQDTGEYVQVGWLHPAYSESRILTDDQRATLEARGLTDPTYVGGWVPVMVPKGADIASSTSEAPRD